MARKENFKRSETHEIVSYRGTFSVGNWVSVAVHTKQARNTTFFLNRQELAKKEVYAFGKS